MARILVIDDDLKLRRTILKILDSLGHELFEAADGNEGMAQIERCRPDLVLTDIIMPDKEGIETILDIRRLHPRVKIIAMSGSGSGQAPQFLSVARKLGADATLHKPFRATELRDTIEQLLAGG